MDSTTGGPNVILGTKRPSMTSMWSMAAPPRSTEAISAARRAKSADRIEGTISTICGLFRSYHSGVETVPRVAARKTERGFGNERGRRGGGHGLVLFRLQRTGGIDQQSAGSEGRAGIGQQGCLAAGQVFQIGRGEAPFDLGIAAEGAGAGAG